MQAGDFPTAWAALLPDSGTQWLQVNFDQAVKIAEIRITESLNPGAVTKVASISDDGKEQVLWEGKDPTVEAPDDFVVKVNGDVIASRVKIYVDTMRKQGWEEIDAVQLVGSDSSVQWASSATASTRTRSSTILEMGWFFWSGVLTITST